MKSLKETASLTESFQLIAITPPGILDPKVAIAASRAEAIGIFNLEFANDPEAALSAINRLVMNARYPCGVKLDAGNSRFNDALIPNLPEGIGIVILAYSTPEEVARCVKELLHSRLIILEALSLKHAQHGYDLGVDGIVAKGNEAAGFVGEKTAFVLFQQIVVNLPLPVWVQGGAGLHTTAAYCAGGAAGIILDSQLYLASESQFSEEIKKHMRRMDGSETICLGNTSFTCRLYNRPGLNIDNALVNLEKETGANRSPDISPLRDYVRKYVAWDENKNSLWLIGQDIAFAEPLSRRFGSVGSILQALRRSVHEHLRDAKTYRILEKDSPLAKSHATLYPIVQGPMARVSDNALFLAQVAEAGALPFLALSYLQGETLEGILKETREMLGERPWGIGILGFAGNEIFEKQLNAVESYKPRFAILAGGMPNQVQALEAKGILTYVHIQSERHMEMFVDSGFRRFIFEGRECGGHIGPRSSFVLWEGMIEEVLDLIKGDAEPEKFHILFAGGIHDALSSAMVACMASPLAKKGVCVGVLMGTAYLFTREIVETGAIVEGFQKNALDCGETCILESGPGHAIRCCKTPFATTFNEEKTKLLSEKSSPDHIRSTLDKLISGRLRIASKGLIRNPAFGARPADHYLLSVSREEQQTEGLYMIGQVAALRNKVNTLKELHHEVSVKSSEILSRSAFGESMTTGSSCDIAIIGIACLFPKAANLQVYWENILEKLNVITEVPSKRWNWQLYFDKDMRARDRIYSKWGGFLDDIPFDPLKFGIPPSSLPSIEPMHLMTLETVSAALKDAGYEKREFPREKTSVIIGTGSGIGEIGQKYVFRATLPTVFEIHSDAVMQRFNEWTEDSFPGILMNVVAGRVANRFNFGGVNYTIDAACASSLAALYDGVRELETGGSDMVIVGGVDASQSPFTFLCFSKTNALSPNGNCRVFDEKADGTVISEGLAMVVLKRLSDAERDGDRIYAVLKSVAGSSDGRGMSMTAPRLEGQLLALNRAYEKAGFSPATVGLFEAHGTGTVVGDQVEAEALISLLHEHGAGRQNSAIGSVKSMIGHTKGAAGLAGLIKAVLSLYHRVLPPTIGVSKPNPKLDFHKGPLYVNTELRPWVRKKNTPRRAGVSAFGFGGTNFHAVLEEYTDNIMKREQPSIKISRPSELFLWSGRSRSEIGTELNSMKRVLDDGVSPRLGDIAFTLYKGFRERDTGNPARLAIVASSLDDLMDKISRAIHLLGEETSDISDEHGIYFGDKMPAHQDKIAFLFPGQGSQYPNMLNELALFFPEVLDCFERANSVLNERFPEGLTGYIFPPPSFSADEEGEQKKKLARTDIAQPSLGAACYGMFTLLQKFGIRPNMTAGHSYGEYVALSAAGVFDEETLYELSETRGRFMIEASGGEDLGTMAAVRMDAPGLKERVKDIDGIVIANINSPQQTVLSGERNAIQKAVELLKSGNIEAQVLPVAGAFHSPLVSPAKKRFSDFLGTVRFNTPALTVFSNTYAAPYESSPGAIRSCLGKHMISPVEFVREIETMYEHGATIFIEVGPGSVLTNLTKQILHGKHFLAFATDARGQSGLGQLLKTLGRLYAKHVPMSLDLLFRGRELTCLDSKTLRDGKNEKHSKTTWLINSANVTPPGAKWKERKQVTPMEAYKLRERRGEPARSNEAVLPPPVSKPEPVFSRDDGKASDSRVSIPDTPIPASKGDSELDAIILEHQRLMKRFLETQERIMMSYLQGSPDTLRPTDEIVTDISPQPVQELRREEIAAGGAVAQSLPQQDEKTGSVESVRNELGADFLKDELLRITSERTGYPAEMLDMDFNIEADLGIDSIKRVEILGSFLKSLPAPQHKKVQSIISDLARLTTLNAVFKRIAEAVLSGVQKEEQEPESRGKDDVLVAPEQSELTRKSLADELLKIVSERTGYPAEMLDMDFNIEADLGIDSIKRVEILAAFAKVFSGQKKQRLQSVIDELSKLKTLKAIIDKSSEAILTDDLKMAGADTAYSGEQIYQQNHESDKDSDGHLPRFLIEPVESPVPEAPFSLTADEVIVITDDGCGAAKILADSLRALGGRPVLLQMGDKKTNAGEGIYHIDLTDPLSVESLISEIRSMHGPVVGLIHLLPLGHSTRMEEMDMNSWHNFLDIEVKSLFHLAKALSADLRNASRRKRGWFIASTMLSEYPYNPQKRDSFAGQAGIAGFLKTLALEWPEVRCRVIHMDAGNSPSVLSRLLINEMATKDKTSEVEYRGSQRMVYMPRQVSLNGVIAMKITSDWVIMVTGGAVGITAEIAHELAMKYKPTLLLVGRSSYPEEESLETKGITSPNEIKEILTRRMRSGKDPVTPAKIEAAYARILKDREIRKNIEKMLQAGARVHYFQADVRDEKGFGELLDEIYQSFGGIDGVIHGAGIIEDKLLEDKTPESFNRVFDTKVDSAFILSRKLRPESLKFIAFFTSVAGFFGNRGQADYAAANEVVNKLALRLDTQWKGRIVAINWGPWKKAGMVTPALEQQFKEKGIQLIPLSAGCRMFEEEIRLGEKGMVEVVIGDGPWKT